jgi:hypothetical protein
MRVLPLFFQADGRPASPSRVIWAACCCLVAVLVVGCGRSIPADSMVLTQVPVRNGNDRQTKDLLDQRYPPGSRVVLTQAAGDPRRIRVLSKGLVAAGSPVISPCGARVLISGRENAGDVWQIYEVQLTGGKPRRVTSMKGGAMDPAYLPDGRLLFSSPVPAVGEAWHGERRPALYAQSLAGGTAEKLTHGLAGAVSSTVLADGRVLFASGGSAAVAVTNVSLFTINNDGTELTPYTGQNDGTYQIWHPRELPDGRVLFLSADWTAAPIEGRVEQVHSARPFTSRAAAFASVPERVRSIEPGMNGDLWVTAWRADAGENGRYAVFRTQGSGAEFGEAWFDDPDWHEVEALAAVPRGMPMGRLSTVKAGAETGMMLCLDANNTMYADADGTVPRATRMRLLAGDDLVEVLGVVPLHPDGSFLVELPANRPIGFEALDDEGRVLRRLPPTVWVRPGENRACVGCHEPRNTAPENRRPLAVKEPMVTLERLLKSVAQVGVEP